MSTAKVTNLQHASATSPNIVLGADGSVSVGGGNISPQTGFKNRIINGDMRIDQRNGGASVTPTSSGTFTVDRWSCSLSQASKFSVQQNAGSVTPPAGFTSYLGATSLSAYSITASDFFAFRHPIEGFNFADLNWGLASAQPITISFWVRSSLTGTFGGALANSGNTRTRTFSYTVNAANTWEYKTITIPGDTGGTWLKNSSVGVSLYFSFGMGSDRTAAEGTFYDANYLSVPGAVSVVGTNGATWYVTGVQLEKGSVATPFEFRSIGQELALCQRYYQVIGKEANTVGYATYASAASQSMYIGVPYNTEMRAAPTVTVNAGASNCTISVIPGINSLRFDLTSVAAGRVASSGNANTFVLSIEL